MESINKSQEIYISIMNELAILCLGEKLNIEFEKINIHKISKLFLGESWVPSIHLGSLSVCAFIQYDGAILTIAGNDLDIVKLKDK